MRLGRAKAGATGAGGVRTALIAAIAGAALIGAAIVLFTVGKSESALPTSERFTDVAAELGIRSRHSAVPPCGINSTRAAWGDANGDGNLDIAATDIGREALLLGRGTDTFREQAEELDFGRERSGDGDSITWGIAFADYDGDAYAAGGGLGFDRGDTPDLLHLNDGNGRFSTVGVPALGSGRSVATADFDRDGDVDIAVGQPGQAQLLLANRGQPHGNWIELRLVGSASARDACGAAVRVQASGAEHLRQVDCRGSAKEIHVGLGDARAADISIRWPSGETQRLAELGAGRLHVVREPRTP